MFIRKENLKVKLEQVKAALKNDGVICIPTDTVYGLACCNNSKKAIDKIYEIKGRDRNKNIPILAASIEDLEKFGVTFNETSLKIAKAFWPGQLTIILDCKPIIQSEKELTNVAVRIPNNEIAREILSYTGPLAVTSANISNENEIDSIAKIQETFKDSIDVYIEDTAEKSNISSTIIKISNPTETSREQAKIEIIREGNITKKQIENILYNKND